MGVYTDGFEKELKKALEADTGFRTNELNEIPFEQLFTKEFMELYTNFASFEELLKASKWEVENRDSFKEIPEDEFDAYINRTTHFPTLKMMYQTAASLFIEGHTH